VLGACLTSCSTHSTGEQTNNVCIVKDCTNRVAADDTENHLCRVNEAEGCYEYNGSCYFVSCPEKYVLTIMYILYKRMRLVL
jgi:hypothetical protein